MYGHCDNSYFASATLILELVWCIVQGEWWQVTPRVQRIGINSRKSYFQNFVKGDGLSFIPFEIYYVKWKNLLHSQTLQKLPSISKNASNKSCWALNFIQKNQWTHMSISLWSGDRELQRQSCLTYYNVNKRENRFTLGLDTAKNTHYIIKKMLQVKVVEHWISYEKVCGRLCLSPSGVELGLQRLPSLELITFLFG